MLGDTRAGRTSFGRRADERAKAMSSGERTREKVDEVAVLSCGYRFLAVWRVEERPT